MGVTKKKPVVAAKATKKRGRPVGSKNKTKSLSSVGFPISKLPIGATVTFEELNQGYIDWEKLAKQLQEALAAEMKENEDLKKIVEDFKAVIRTDTSFTFWDRLVFLFSGKL